MAWPVRGGTGSVPDAVEGALDGQAVGPPVTPATFSAEGGVWVFDQPFYLILNLAVGNRWTGKANPTTRFPATMK